MAVFFFAGLGQFFLAQPEHPFTLWLGLGFYGFSLPFLFKIFPSSPRPAYQPPQEPSALQEGFFFLWVLLLAIFFRTYRIQEFPDGLFADRAEVALGALRILNDHWRPFENALSLHVPELWIYYLVAGWFKLFGSSPDILSYFDAFLSLAGILLAYIAFRQISGPKTALLAFFFLAVMRWNFLFGRKIYYQSQTVFFGFLALSLLLYAFQAGKKWRFAVAGGATALGLYSYQALKALPLLILVWMAFDLAQCRKTGQKRAAHWIVFWLAFLCVSLPYLDWMSKNHVLGRREAEVSVFTQIQSQHSLLPLGRTLVDTALVFNRWGNSNAQSNFLGHRMLDDVTGILFVLGFFHGIFRIREKKFFYAISGICVMSLPSILSINGGHGGRMLGVTPFAAYLCSLFINEWCARWDFFFQNKKGLKIFSRGLGLGLLGAVVFLNFYAYFFQQTANPDYMNDFSWPETKVGQAVAGADDKTEFFLASRFYGHPTVEYLGYSRRNRTHPLNLNDPPRVGDYPKGESFCFFLDELKMGALDFLNHLYPGGKTEVFHNPLGKAPLCSYRVSPDALADGGLGLPLVQKGLYGVYRHWEQGGEKPFLERWDPVINFTFRDLPSTSSPLFIHWSGRFKAPVAGSYQFLVITYETSQARLVIDQKWQSDFIPHPSFGMKLGAGWHQLDLFFKDAGEPMVAVNLLWKKPGQEKFEFVSNEFFGKVH